MHWEPCDICKENVIVFELKKDGAGWRCKDEQRCAEVAANLPAQGAGYVGTAAQFDDSLRQPTSKLRKMNDHDPGDEHPAPRHMQLRLCPFCKTITYYDDAVVTTAANDGLFRTACKYCGLKFWPGTKEDINARTR